VADARVVEIDLRENMIDDSGQRVITSDKVTLHMNAVVGYRIADTRKAVAAVPHSPRKHPAHLEATNRRR
jgi:regulator of protease activity HflC (stomatin/prohibitin superfamily)